MSDRWKWFRFFWVALVALLVFNYFARNPDEGVGFIAAMVFAYVVLDVERGK